LHLQFEEEDRLGASSIIPSDSGFAEYNPADYSDNAATRASSAAQIPHRDAMAQTNSDEEYLQHLSPLAKVSPPSACDKELFEGGVECTSCFEITDSTKASVYGCSNCDKKVHRACFEQLQEFKKRKRDEEDEEEKKCMSCKEGDMICQPC
jgi:hypothetical protein